MSESNKVYSSEKGRLCPKCEKPINSCICLALSQKKIIGSGNVRVRRENKGRGGKTVTVITDVPLDAEGLKALATELKRLLGVGGTIKNGQIEIQGDYLDKVIKLLINKGFKTKQGGG